MNNSYCSNGEADYYLGARLFTEKWFNATPDRKSAALVHASRIIDALSFRGLKPTASQQTEWPRVLEPQGVPVLPQEVVDASCEIALALVNGIDPEIEFRDVSKSQVQYGNLRTNRDTTMVEPHFANGVPSITAWNLLKPYLTDITQAVVFRS